MIFYDVKEPHSKILRLKAFTLKYTHIITKKRTKTQNTVTRITLILVQIETQQIKLAPRSLFNEV